MSLESIRTTVQSKFPQVHPIKKFFAAMALATSTLGAYSLSWSIFAHDYLPLPVLIYNKYGNAVTANAFINAEILGLTAIILGAIGALITAKKTYEKRASITSVFLGLTVVIGGIVYFFTTFSLG